MSETRPEIYIDGVGNLAIDSLRLPLHMIHNWPWVQKLLQEAGLDATGHPIEGDTTVRQPADIAEPVEIAWHAGDQPPDADVILSA